VLAIPSFLVWVATKTSAQVGGVRFNISYENKQYKLTKVSHEC